MIIISLHDDDHHHQTFLMIFLQITYCIADSAGGGLSLQAVTPTQPMPEEEEVDIIIIIFYHHITVWWYHGHGKIIWWWYDHHKRVDKYNHIVKCTIHTEHTPDLLNCRWTWNLRNWWRSSTCPPPTRRPCSASPLRRSGRFGRLGEGQLRRVRLVWVAIPRTIQPGGKHFLSGGLVF